MALSRRSWIVLAIIGVALTAILLSQTYWRMRTSRPPTNTIVYDLVFINNQPPPWPVINNAVMVLLQTGGQLHLEPSKSAGKAWTTTRLQQGTGRAPRTRTVTNHGERFVIAGDSLQVITSGRCKRVTVFAISEDRAVLEQRSVRESGGGCDNAPPDVAARLRELREQPREYRRRGR